MRVGVLDDTPPPPHTHIHTRGPPSFVTSATLCGSPGALRGRRAPFRPCAHGIPAARVGDRASDHHGRLGSARQHQHGLPAVQARARAHAAHHAHFAPPPPAAPPPLAYLYLWRPRFASLASKSVDDGERVLQSAPKAKMAERTCNQRAAVLQHLNVLLPDMIQHSSVGRVRAELPLRVLLPGPAGVSRGQYPHTTHPTHTPHTPTPPHPRTPTPHTTPAPVPLLCSRTSWQSFLRLLALYNTLLRKITSKEPFTLRKLSEIQRDYAVPFVKAYEDLVAKIQVGKHCTAKMAARLVSVTFPKLHLLLHMCDQIASLGHVWWWNTGEFRLQAAPPPPFPHWCSLLFKLACRTSGQFPRCRAPCTLPVPVPCCTPGSWEMCLKGMRGCFRRTTANFSTTHLELSLSLGFLSKLTTQYRTAFDADLKLTLADTAGPGRIVPPRRDVIGPVDDDDEFEVVPVVTCASMRRALTQPQGLPHNLLNFHEKRAFLQVGAWPQSSLLHPAPPPPPFKFPSRCWHR